MARRFLLLNKANFHDFATEIAGDMDFLPLQGVLKPDHSDDAVANARALPSVASCGFCQYKFTYNPIYTLEYNNFSCIGPDILY